MIIKANSLHIPLKDESVHCVITSPPYWGLRLYSIPQVVWDDPGNCEHIWEEHLPEHHPGQVEHGQTAKSGQFCQRCGAWLGHLGLEPSIELYIQHIVQIFREAKRVLRDDGVSWLNMGDSYTSGNREHRRDPDSKNPAALQDFERLPMPNNLKPKDLCMMPSRVALALQNNGWYLRSMIPWLKRNCMPESCHDRPTTAVEYIFLFSKSPRYFYDAEAVKKIASPDTHARYARDRSDHHKWADGGPGDQTIAKSFAHMAEKSIAVPDSYHGSVPGRKDGPGQDRRSQTDRRPCAGWHQGTRGEGCAPRDRRIPGVNPKAMPKDAGRDGPGWRNRQNESFCGAVKDIVETRMRRVSDWFFESWQGFMGNEEGQPLAMVVNPQGFSGAHYACFPEAMVEPLILAGCPRGGIVLDPFSGSGTTLRVAERLGRKAIGLDLGYHELAKQRIKNNQIVLPGLA